MKFSVKYNVLIHQQNNYLASCIMQPLYSQVVFGANMIVV